MSGRFHIAPEIGRAVVAAPELTLAQVSRRARRWQRSISSMNICMPMAGCEPGLKAAASCGHEGRGYTGADGSGGVGSIYR